MNFAITLMTEVCILQQPFIGLVQIYDPVDLSSGVFREKFAVVAVRCVIDRVILMMDQFSSCMNMYHISQHFLSPEVCSEVNSNLVSI